MYCVLRLPRKREVRRLCVLRLPGKRQPRASGGHRAAAPLESSVYCACTREVRRLCVLRLPGKRQPRASGGHRAAAPLEKLCVLRLPRTREVQRLCVLRLPGKRQPRASGGHRAAAPGQSSMYCACHAKGKTYGLSQVSSVSLVLPPLIAIFMGFPFLTLWSRIVACYT